MFSGFERRLAGNVSGGLTVANDVEKIRPDLIFCHGQIEVKERTSWGSEMKRDRGANLVIGPDMKSTPEQHDPDWPRYPETILSFSTESVVEIDLRKIPSEHALAQLGAAGFGQPFAVLTAFDPRGENLSAAQNEKRRRDLDDRLRAAGYKFVHVDACSPDRSHCECSVAVLMPQNKAIDLARELEQVAIFWFDGKRFWILGALVESDPVMLPRNS